MLFNLISYVLPAGYLEAPFYQLCANFCPRLRNPIDKVLFCWILHVSCSRNPMDVFRLPLVVFFSHQSFENVIDKCVQRLKLPGSTSKNKQLLDVFVLEKFCCPAHFINGKLIPNENGWRFILVLKEGFKKLFVQTCVPPSRI